MSLVNTQIKQEFDADGYVAMYSFFEDNKIQEIYRVHVLFDKVLSFYAVNSKNIIFHNIDMTKNDIDRFIKTNKKFCSIMPKIEKQIIYFF